MMKKPQVLKRNVLPNTQAWSLSTHPHVSGNLSEAHTATEPFSNFATALYLFSLSSPPLWSWTRSGKSSFPDNLLYI